MILMFILYFLELRFHRKQQGCSRKLRLVVFYDNRYHQPLEYVEEIISRMDTFGYTAVSLSYALECVQAPEQVRAIFFSPQGTVLPPILKKMRGHPNVTEFAVEFDL